MGLLDGKVAVVTGAGGGIGREIAVAMAAAGARVVVNDIGINLAGSGEHSSAPAEETKALIESTGGQAVISTESVAGWESARRIVGAAIDAFGQIDIVVNNAGIVRDAIFHKMTEEEWSRVVDVHLNGSFFMSRAAADHFRIQGAGAYVHMVSTSGLIGNVGQANYSAAKLGIVALSKSIALDMRRFGVRSNCIGPFAWTRMTSVIPNNPDQEARIAALRAVGPEKNAPLAVYLASDAAKDVNGQVFGVRKNEIFLFGQYRPVRGIHRDSGWTPETVAERGMPALKGNFTPLDVTADVFTWDPI
jgi:NAD(P)-dependent dehydrogenase (short-subunit alcohol dehydrogenase family)